jgi:O-antigen/teichoic acid export membrane protein
MLALRWCDRLIAIASMVVLARLLAPTDFGLVGYAWLVIGLVELLTPVATDSALIRDQAAGRSEYDGAWTINAIRGLIVGVLVAAMAAPAAAYFRDARVEPILYWLAMMPLLRGLENVGTVEFRKKLEFDRQFVFRLSSRLAGTLATVIVAFTWRSYWALVVGALVQCATALALSYGLHAYRPRPDLRGERGLLRFTGWLALHDIANGIADRLPGFVVGRIGDPSALAFLSTARDVADMGVNELRAPMRAALFPGLAKLAGEPERLRAALVESTGVLALLSLPLPLGLTLLAPDLVPLLFGEKWLPMVPVLQVLSVSGTLSALFTNSHLLLLIVNKPQLLLVVTVLRLLVVAPVALLLVPAQGPIGAAYAILASVIATLVADYLLCSWRLGIAPRRFVAALWRPVLATIAMGVAVELARRIAVATPTTLHQVLRVAALIGVGAVTYVGCGLAVWRLAGRPDGAERRALELLGIRQRRTPPPGRS